MHVSYRVVSVLVFVGVRLIEVEVDEDECVVLKVSADETTI